MSATTTAAAIVVRYRSCDGYSKTARFKTLKGAQAFAHRYIGETPEMGGGYAVSSDGIGTIRCTGATLAELFPATVAATDPKFTPEADPERDVGREYDNSDAVAMMDWHSGAFYSGAS